MPVFGFRITVLVTKTGTPNILLIVTVVCAELVQGESAAKEVANAKAAIQILITLFFQDPYYKSHTL